MNGILPPLPTIPEHGQNNEAAPARVPALSNNKKMDVPIPPAVIHDAMSGLVFSRGGVLGEGGFARCFEVQDDRKQRLAAKVVAKCTIKTKKQRQKLSSEIKIHERLLHQNVVRFYHKFEDDQFVFMIMELCENKTLVDLLKHRKRLTESETRGIMAQLLSGVQYMHSQSVIHRDLKLGNLFLDRNMQLKIGDFGLAAVIQHNGDRKKTICGTPNYIAPEVLFDTQNGHSYEVDIWSVGVVMYTLLVGKPPFQKKDVKAIYKKIRENSYEFPPEIELSVEAKSLITSLLHSQPECRPALEQIMEHDFFKCGPVRPISVSYARPPEPHAHIPGHQDPKAPQKPQMSVKPSRSPLAPVGSNNITNHPSDPSAKATGSVPARRSHNENDPYVPAKKQKSPVVKMPGAYTSPNKVTNGSRSSENHGNGIPEVTPNSPERVLRTPEKPPPLDKPTSGRKAEAKTDGLKESSFGQQNNGKLVHKENLPTREEVGRFLSTLASASRSSGTEPSHVRQLQRSNSRTRGSESSQGGHSNQVPGQPDDTSTAPMDYSPTAPERIRSHSNIPVASQPQQRSQRPLSTANVEWPQSNEVPGERPKQLLRRPSASAVQQHAPKHLNEYEREFEVMMIDQRHEVRLNVAQAANGTPVKFAPERAVPPPPVRRQTNVLENMARNLSNAFMVINGQMDITSLDYVHAVAPTLFVSKWIDYSNKYGLGYQLRDGSVGVYFNDSTSIILSADGSHFEYLFYDNPDEIVAGLRGCMHRESYTLERFPPTLNKKVTLLKHFRGYMLENLNEGTDGPIQQHGSKTSGLDFVTKYMRTKISVVFRLSNQLVQINFNDHTKMILSDDGLTVTYVNLNREMSTKALVNLVVERPAEILERLAFAKDILSAMLKKRGQTAAAPGANTQTTAAPPASVPSNASPNPRIPGQSQRPQSVYSDQFDDHGSEKREDGDPMEISPQVKRVAKRTPEQARRSVHYHEGEMRNVQQTPVGSRVRHGVGEQVATRGLVPSRQHLYVEVEGQLQHHRRPSREAGEADERDAQVGWRGTAMVPRDGARDELADGLMGLRASARTRAGAAEAAARDPVGGDGMVVGPYALRQRRRR